MTDPKKRKYIIEVKKKERWVFRSGHKNSISADANFEAVSKKVSIRMKEDGIIIKEREGIEDGN